jgi:hypothetical protein
MRVVERDLDPTSSDSSKQVEEFTRRNDGGYCRSTDGSGGAEQLFEFPPKASLERHRQV